MRFEHVSITIAVAVPSLLLLLTVSAFHHQSALYIHRRNHNNITPLLSTTTSSDVDVSSSPKPKPKKVKLSRPERKALERKRKAQAKNYRQRAKHHTPEAARDQEGEGPYDLHSTAISKLTKESTLDDVTRAIKRAQNTHDIHDIRHIENFLIDEVDEHFAYGYRGSLLSRLAVAAMHMNDHEMAMKAIETRHTQHFASMLPLESAAIVRGLLRIHQVSDALNVLHDELSLPLPGTPVNTPEAQERIKHRVLAMTSVISRHFFELEPHMAVDYCHKISELGPIVKESGLTTETLQMPWLRLIKGAAKCESARRAGTLKGKIREEELPCNLVYSVLEVMAAYPSDNDDEVYEALSNALVRRSVFVDGVTTIDGLPAADRGEAVFIGRSNVGKSSLVNMVTNRKSLAYTSKRPGKTQQFNYFAVNDKHDLEREIRFGDVVDGEKDLDSFYMVDFPGFGFAQVPQHQRQEWYKFTNDYVTKRKSLSVVFHLVDSRHGPTNEDEKIMKQMGENLAKDVNYVVVLTKTDKNGKNKDGNNRGHVKPTIMNKLKDTMDRSKVGHAPVLLTSAETKLGRDDVWRYLKLAAQS